MKTSIKFYLFGYIIPPLLLIFCFIINASIICIVAIGLSLFIARNIKCPGCHKRILDFYDMTSKDFEGSILYRLKLPDKCPHCGCDWE
jgi:hypothetical protein